MLKYVGYNIVFKEIPDEVTLALSISNCPFFCEGCHSPELRQNIGATLDKCELKELYLKYHKAITCICFMGGDSDPVEVEKLALFVREISGGLIKTAWYSGRNEFPDQCYSGSFNFIKLGEYKMKLGGLDSPLTNQRVYKIVNNDWIDITHLF